MYSLEYIPELFVQFHKCTAHSSNNENNSPDCEVYINAPLPSILNLIYLQNSDIDPAIN